MVISTVKVELGEGDELQEPEQHLDQGEFIEKRIVAVSDLYETLLGAPKYVDSSLHEGKSPWSRQVWYELSGGDLRS